MYFYVLSYAATARRTEVQHVVGKSLKEVITKAVKKITRDYYEGDKSAIVLKFDENSNGDVWRIRNTAFDSPKSYGESKDSFLDSKGVSIPGFNRELADWFGINFECVVSISRHKV